MTDHQVVVLVPYIYFIALLTIVQYIKSDIKWAHLCPVQAFSKEEKHFCWL